MTKSELETIKRRCEAATPGPWAWEAYGEKENCFHVGIAFDKNDCQLSGEVQTDRYDEEADVFIEDVLWKDSVGDKEGATVNYDDAEFIAHARTDVPALVAEVKMYRDFFKEHSVGLCACVTCGKIREVLEEK